jgi:restriction system protein
VVYSHLPWECQPARFDEEQGMPVPKFDALMLPLLKFASDGKAHRLNDAMQPIADELGLSEADRAEQIPSGQSRFRNRIYWAKLYLSQAKAVDSAGQGLFRISDRGRELLARTLACITPELLMEFPEFVAFRAKSKSSSVGSGAVTANEAPDSNETPEDTIASAYQQYKAAITKELLDAVREAKPILLSKIMVNLLEAMGYGDKDSGIVLDGVNDGGVDGVVPKDRLGLSSVYIQAKRYKEGSNIGSPDIQQFAGSMQQHRADEGVFVATSDFTKAALDSASQLRARIVLINGSRLAELMFELNVGVSTVETYHLKRLSSDFFAPE